MHRGTGVPGFWVVIGIVVMFVAYNVAMDEIEQDLKQGKIWGRRDCVLIGLAVGAVWPILLAVFLIYKISDGLLNKSRSIWQEFRPPAPPEEAPSAPSNEPDPSLLID